MKKSTTHTIILLLFFFTANAQVGIGVTTPHSSAVLELKASSNNKGILITRLSKTQRDAIVTPATGLLIYQTDNTPGFYYYNGTAWTAVGGDGLGNHIASTDLDMDGNNISSSSDLEISSDDELELVSSEEMYLYSSSSIEIDTAEENGGSINLKSNEMILLKPGKDSDDILYHIDIKGPITNSDKDQKVTLEALRNKQDVQIRSYDEIYITTVDGDGDDPDNTEYNTNGDIELTSSDDIIMTAETDINLTSSDEINLKSEEKIELESKDSDIILNPDSGNNVIIENNGSTVYELPNTTGSNGQVLTTNGSGVASWTTFSGGASKLDDLSDVKSEGTNFSRSLLIGHQNTGSLNSATYNTAVGLFAFDAVTEGDANTTIGYSSLTNNTTGSNNTAVGYYSLAGNQTGGNNVGVGMNALFSNITNSNNVAVGGNALFSNKADNNIAIGFGSAYKNDTGTTNISIGNNALYTNETGDNNIAIGQQTLNANTGSDNVHIGAYSGGLRNGYNTESSQNIALGSYSLGGFANSKGADKNVAIGYYALKDLGETSTATDGPADLNIGLGYMAGRKLKTASQYTVLGANAGNGSQLLTGSNVTLLGYDAEPSSASVSNEITLGNSSVSTLRAQVTSITSLSDRRDKKNIVEISEGLNFVQSLKPVTFDWNNRDGAKVDVPAAGFIAQDLLALQKASSIGDHLDLVSENNPDKLEARYANLLPVLVKAIQEQQVLIKALQERVAILEAQN